MSSSVPFLKRFKNGFPFFSMEDKTQPVLSIPQERVEYKTGIKIESREKREGELIGFICQNIFRKVER